MVARALSAKNRLRCAMGAIALPVMATLWLCIAALAPGIHGTAADAARNISWAGDCTTDAELSAGSTRVIHYVVWCGVRSGRVTLRIKRNRGLGLTGFSRTAKASGPGAAGVMRCRELHGSHVFCSARTTGPVTFRGTVTLAPGTRCAAYLELDIGGWTGDSADFPNGCPRAYPPKEPRLREITVKRAEDGLDRDLAGNRAAIVRRAKELLAAWRHGNPVARWAFEDDLIGLPLRPAEQVELEYRDTYFKRFVDVAVEGDWVANNAPTTYAGYEIDEAAGGIIYVGFTVEPVATLEKLRRRLIAPDRFQPFPVTPRYTEAELEKVFKTTFLPRNNPLGKLTIEAGINNIANKIEIETAHVARVRRLITDLYGPEAPFEVVYTPPPSPFYG